MSMRTSSGVLFALVLAGCGGKVADHGAKSRPGAAGAPAGEAEERIACARGDEAFAPNCTIERARTPAGLFLTLRRLDGGFRRLQVLQDGRGVVAADGAEPAIVTPIGPESIEVSLGDMRYRLPAIVRQPKAAR
jgi:hypothetical protein